MQALDYEIWEVVCQGPFTLVIKNEEGKEIPKPSSQSNDSEKRKMSLIFLFSKSFNWLEGFGIYLQA